MPFFNNKKEFQHIFSQAILDQQVVPYFQPIYSIDQQQIAGFEVLVRWNSPTGILLPERFMTYIESHELLNTLLLNLMQQAFSFLQNLPNNFYLSFNLSPIQLQDVNLVTLIKHQADQFAFPLSKLTLEITETSILENTEISCCILNKLNQLGCKIALDDFGTGYSSLSLIKNIDLSIIKIDRSFIQDLFSRKESRKIVTAIINLGQTLDLDIIAEGVETAEQQALLGRMGCHYIQGFLISKPVPATDILSLLKETKDNRSTRFYYQNMSSEQRNLQLAVLYQSNKNSIAFLDKHYHLIEANVEFFSRLQLSRQELLGRALNQILPALFIDFEQNPLAEIAKEVRYGSGNTDMVIVSPIFDEISEFVGFSFLGIDITRNKDIEKELSISALLNPRMSWQMDKYGEVIKIDPRLLPLFRLNFDDLAGSKWKNLVHPEDKDRINHLLQRSVQTGTIYDTKYRLLLEGYYQWVHAYMAPHIEEGNIKKWFGQLEIIQDT